MTCQIMVCGRQLEKRSFEGVGERKAGHTDTYVNEVEKEGIETAEGNVNPKLHGWCKRIMKKPKRVFREN